jgi:glc operon protein GlcG
MRPGDGLIGKTRLKDGFGPRPIWTSAQKKPMKRTHSNLIAAALLLSALPALAQAPAPAAGPAPSAPSPHAIGYGEPVSLARAKALSAAAVAEAVRIGVPVVVAITDTSGTLVHLERQDNAILAGVTVAQEKARSAAVFKRPTKTFEDAIASGQSGNRVLGLAGAVPIALK